MAGSRADREDAAAHGMSCSKSSVAAAEDRGNEPQPPGYSRDDAERRLAEKLARFERLPDGAIVTIFLGDLRKLNERAGS